MKTENKYFVLNETDGIYAYGVPMPRQLAERFIAEFPERFKAQGYYASAHGHIPISELKLSLVKACSFEDCQGDVVSACDHCDGWFCSDHGSVGGDVEGDENSLAHAVPSECWQCGGFNADTYFPIQT